MKKKTYIPFIAFIFSLVISPLFSPAQDTLFHQGFETAGESLPENWINLRLSQSEGEWKAGEGAGTFTSGQVGIPDTAAVGLKNVYYRIPSANPHVVRLISPPINLEFAVFPELTFWHVQYPRNGAVSKLVVYYAESADGPWHLLANYQNPVLEWTKRTFQLPSGISSLYLAFEGHSGAGTPGSVCVDEIIITETGAVERYLEEIKSFQATSDFIASGSVNNPILKTELRVMGNTGDLILEELSVNSLNSDDSDLEPQGVKLWITQDENFINPLQLSNATDFINGTATFSNLYHRLPTGYSYLWVTYDISEMAGHGNFVDCFIPAQAIVVNGAPYPEVDQNPPGEREIQQTLFYDNFETDKGWILTGEWQRDVPSALGGYLYNQEGTEGPADPSVAFSGSKILGTDLTGLGIYPGNYEPFLQTEEYQAIMPAQNFLNYNNLTLSFRRWLNIYFFDKATIDFSTDGGVSWTNIWTNQLVTNESSWSQVAYPLAGAARKENVLIRFTLGDTGGTNMQSGWNLDEVVITGDYIKTDVGITELYSPQSSCGLTAEEIVKVQVKNFGALPSPDTIPLAFSLDGGNLWHRDTIFGSVPVGGTIDYIFDKTADLSDYGYYSNFLIRTELPGDQDLLNDQLHTEVISIPTVQPTFYSDFEQAEGFQWLVKGTNSSWQLEEPSGTHLNDAYSGDYAWVTNAAGYYNKSEYSWVESPCFDFSLIENPVIDFFLRTHTLQGLDGAAMDFSTDGGNTWQRLHLSSPELARDWYNNYSVTQLNSSTGDGSGWTGTTSGWLNPRIVLPGSTGYQSSVRFRLLFASNPVEVDYEGIAFDDFSVYSAPDDIGITALIEPQNSCMLQEEQTITVEIKNTGINKLLPGTIIPAGIDDLNNDESYIEEFELEEELLPGETINYTFSQEFNMQASGTYTFLVYTLLSENPDFWQDNSDNDSLTAEITVYGLPEVYLGEDIYTTSPDTLILDAGSGFYSYLWQDNSTDQTFQVSSNNTQQYYVTVTDHNACNATDSIKIITRDLAIEALLSPVDNCSITGGDNIRFAILNNGHDVFTAGTEIPFTLIFEDEHTEDLEYFLHEDLLPGMTHQIEFNTTNEPLEQGQYTIIIEHHFHDANPSNDYLEKTITAYGFPDIELGDDIFSTQPDSILLDAGEGFSSYLWQDGSTLQTYQVNNPHSYLYHVTVTDENGCSSQDQIQVFTFDVTVSQISEPVNSCEFEGPQQVTVSLLNSGADNLEAGTSFEIELLVNEEYIVTDHITLNQEWASSSLLNHSFSEEILLEKQEEYEFDIIVDFDDADTSNNQYSQIINATGHPEVNLPEVIVTNQPDTVVLNAGEGFFSYLWSTGSTEQTIQAETWGTYWVSVENEIGCATTAYTEVEPESIDLSLKEIISPESICENKPWEISVKVAIENAGNIPVNQGSQFELWYQVENQPQMNQQITLENDLMPGDSLHITFSGNFETAAINDFILNAGLYHPNDENDMNNTLNRPVIINQAPEPWLGDTIYDPNPAGTILSLTESYTGYLWQDGSTDPEFEITSQYSSLYHVTVTDHNGCMGSDSVMVIAWDIEISEVLSPESYCTLSEDEAVEVIIRNNGPDTFEQGHVLTLQYFLDDNQPVEQQFELSDPFEPQQELTLVFEQNLDLSATGIFDFHVILKQDDVDEDNNNILKIIDHSGLPHVDLGGNINTGQPDTLVLFAGEGFTSYEWQNGETDPFFNVENYGWHWVVVMDKYGCSGGDTIYIGQNTAAHNVPDAKVWVYPNPADEKVMIKFTLFDESAVLELRDQRGNLITRKKHNNQGIILSHFDLDGLSSGVYYIRMFTNDEVVVRKLIISAK